MKHRILVVGTGSIGERHVRCFLATGRVEVAAVEPNEALRNKVAQSYNLKESFSSLEYALALPWDGAVVATPAPFHIPIANQLAAAGINMYIEKPLATTLDGLEQLVSTVQAKKIFASVAYVYRAHPAIAAVKNELQTGRFGKPLQIVSNCGQNFPFYRPAYRQTYYTRHSSGGGAIQDAWTHIIDAAQWLVGPVTRLCSSAQHKLLEGTEVEDTVHVLADHGKVMGCYSLNQHQCANENTITINCEKGSLKVELHESRWGWVDKAGGSWNFVNTPIKERDDWFTRQEQIFLDGLEGKAAPLCSLEEGIQTLKVNLAALKSASQNSTWLDII